jgi:hypothetical protein
MTSLPRANRVTAGEVMVAGTMAMGETGTTRGTPVEEMATGMVQEMATGMEEMVVAIRAGTKAVTRAELNPLPASHNLFFLTSLPVARRFGNSGSQPGPLVFNFNE